MGISAPLLSAAGVIGAVTAMLLDGRRAVAAAVACLAAGLAPTAAAFGGGPGVATVAASAVAALALGWGGWAAGRLLPWVAGLDPVIPAFATRRQLFGPRSTRAFAAAVAVPIASWVSFTVPVGDAPAAEGFLFPAAYTWTCGVLRLVVARTVEDLSVGVAMISLSAGTAWLLRGGVDALAGAAIACSVPPLATLVAGWLAGRHARRAHHEQEPAG
jgi:hypothetical protein